MKLVVCFLVILTSLSLSGSDILKKVGEKYDKIQTISADFSQKITYSSNDRKTQFAGHLLIEKPDKMRMSVFEPDTQLMISNVGSLWVYIKSAKQAMLYSLNKETYPQLGSLIFDVSKQFESELVGKNKDRYVLRLIPRQESNYYDSLYAKISRRSYLITGLTVFDKQANRIDYTFRKIRINVPVPKGQFTFVPPPGTAIIKRQ